MREAAGLAMPMPREMRMEMRDRFEAVENRLAKLEEGQRSFEQALTSDTASMRLVTGNFEPRVVALNGKTMVSEGLKA